MSYYQALPSYYRNPAPPYGPGGDYGAPVPGWGTLPHMAGPARLAVGQTVPVQQEKFQAFRPKDWKLHEMRARLESPKPTSGIRAVPWWVWLAVPVVIGGAALALSGGGR